MTRGISEEFKTWLFDLCHDNLKDWEVLTGWVKFYALEGHCIDDVQDDIIFRTSYGEEAVRSALETIKRVLGKVAEGDYRLFAE